MLFTSFLMGLALSMDALAVSISASICSDSIPRAVGLRAALFFGLFQFAMPLAGWLLGSAFRQYIQAYDHWIAFGLLAFVGGKMLWEGIRLRIPAFCPDPDDVKDHGIMKIHSLAILALATSIDALAVGLSLSVIGSPILWPSVIIGLTTFAVCLMGIQFGKNLKRLFGDWADIVGGIVLIGIGTKILIEHLVKNI
jgi:putative Mn2+ efflux pump MntP